MRSVFIIILWNQVHFRLVSDGKLGNFVRNEFDKEHLVDLELVTVGLENVLQVVHQIGE
jgi:hypothetical protein